MEIVLRDTIVKERRLFTLVKIKGKKCPAPVPGMDRDMVESLLGAIAGGASYT